MSSGTVASAYVPGMLFVCRSELLALQLLAAAVCSFRARYNYRSTPCTAGAADTRAVAKRVYGFAAAVLCCAVLLLCAAVL
jgi:hypothetical protein